MQITFLGAAGTVTGSKYLIKEGSWQGLVDCGLFQGLKELRLKNWAPLIIPPSTINEVLLTHAHIDHSGYLPLLVKNGFHGKIYCTSSTERLCQLLLPDSGKIQEEEAQYANRKGFSKHRPALPLYTENDAFDSLKFFAPVSFNESISLTEEISSSFSPAGHILGASCVTLRSKNNTIVFSGDLGRQSDLIMHPPTPIKHADYLILESTYGGKLHEKIDPLSQLETVINNTLARKGTLVIPSFAVGRAQTLLYAIYCLKKEKRIPEVPVFLNSPMAIDATRAFCDFQNEHRLSEIECQAFIENVRYVQNAEESKALNLRKDPMILIAASGMATGGRVLHHLKAFAPEKRNTLLFSGFQAAGTRGDSLVKGAKEVKIHGQMVPIEAEVVLMDSLSAHADQMEIITWLSQFEKAPKKTFITHGEPEASLKLQEVIKNKLGWNCHIPKLMEQVEL